ncbi:hypothetical protein DCE79_10780 [Lysinibacillus sp. 2017]|uniref:N-acetylmuramoyl-L-alanine amidase n=1 Tax=unclassified Lysinibacillus TaxID=2636778 RepID=UPI000D52A5D7|nr:MULTISPECIES: N-acetylmuramoyl-L-alanine amidase [unclassified Lysinibacillus]AWE07840.1 hypothetical protein DCE79_10780 [Lysinibacillus sp. 2017]TGN32267.1 N-acetylmuramoyl-L-alanine amidase [Lysinibacillus sp. S2017]
MLTISAGHYGKGTGAKDLIDEGEEVIFVVKELAKRLKSAQIHTNIIIDQQSKNQQQNLAYLVKVHNKTNRKLDVSIHFNAVRAKTTAAIGTEVLYVNPAILPLAKKMSAAISNAGGFKNRGAKRRTDLAILNKTTAPAILIEICFVNSTKDILLYHNNQFEIFDAIVQVLLGFV